MRDLSSGHRPALIEGVLMEREFDELAEALGAPARKSGCYDHHHGCPVCGSVDNLHVWVDDRGLGVFCFGCEAGIQQVREALDMGWTPPADLVQRQKAKAQTLGRVVKRTPYIIRDQQGKNRAIHTRLDTEDGDKLYVWDWPAGKMDLADVPLYGCEDVAGFDPQEPIIVVEGEGVRDLLAASGYQTVAVAGGASSKPSREVLSVLDGRDLIAWADYDDPGRKLMQYIASNVRDSSVRMVQPWPGIRAKDDAKDFLKEHTLEEADALLRAAVQWMPIVSTRLVAPEHLIRQSRAAWYFAQMAGDRVRFDHGRGRWLVWAGHRWRPDESGEVERLWLDVLGDRLRDAVTSDHGDREAVLKAVQSAGATNGAATAGLDLASSMEPIATKADAWDPDPWFLGCENGVVDLQTGELRDGRPEDMISRSTGISYDPAATCPRWDKFLLEVFDNDEELADWFGLLIGTSLVGVVQELVAIHHGTGNNGKSVARERLLKAFGDYAIAIPIETLVNAKRSAGEATPDLIPLRGARIAFASEPDQTAKLRGGVLKRIASVDRMTGRPLYGSTQTWVPTHTVHMATNHLPLVDDPTEGFWRRIAPIPWNKTFQKSGTGPREDPDLAAKLDAELPGILAWAVRYAVAFAEGRSLHPFPAAVQAKTETYRANSDRLGPFIAEHVVYAKSAQVGVRELFMAYATWCDREGIPPLERLRQTRFLNEFEEHGGVRRAKDPQNRRYFVGAGLSTNRDVHDVSPSNAATSPSSSHVESSGNTGPNVTTVTETPGTPGTKRSRINLRTGKRTPLRVIPDAEEVSS